MKKFLKETEEFDKKQVAIFDDTIEIYHAEDSVIMDKIQAEELFEILKEYLGKKEVN
ncbi:hypothetical protein [Escherichia phage UPEC06]|nr:hypothetical protein [Escherichia phage UPEC06]